MSVNVQSGDRGKGDTGMTGKWVGGRLEPMLKDSQEQRALQHHGCHWPLGTNLLPRSHRPPWSCCAAQELLSAVEPLSTLEPISHLGVNSTQASPLLVVVLGPICHYPAPVSVSGVIFVKPLTRPPTPLQVAKAMLSHGHL